MDATSDLLKLHVGCGSDVVPGWENLDKSPSIWLSQYPRVRAALYALRVVDANQRRGFPSGIKYANAARSLPYPDASASHVYTSHMIKHLSRWQGLSFVRECARVLAPGGL